MNGVYKLLQSGFIGEDTSDLIQIPEEERSLVQAVITQTIFRVDTSNYYDKAVTQLYAQMAADPKVFSDFAYRELLLKKAMVLLGEESFGPWFRAQDQSPCFSYLHERFLKETLLFIYNRQPRSMSHSSYFRLLHVGANNPSFSAQQKETEAYELKQILSRTSNGLTVDMVKQWTCTVEGLQDLLATLNVIYGRRTTTAA